MTMIFGGPDDGAGGVADRADSPTGSLSRRSVMLGAAAATLGVTLLDAGAQPASAQVVETRPPIIDTSNPEQIADGVWVLRDHRIWLVPNIGIVVGRDAALVIDAGLGPENGKRVYDTARHIAGGRRLILTTTHFHPEHTTGAQAFPADVSYVCNTAQRDDIRRNGARFVDLFRKTQSAAAITALEGTRIIEPGHVYDGASTRIDLGGRVVELHATGTAHTLGDQFVSLPKERILFAGDLIEERMFPIFPWFPPQDTEIDAANWTATLDGFRRFDPALIVPGHGDPGGITIATALAAQIDAVERRVRALAASGRSADDIIRDNKAGLAALTPGWEHPQLLDWQINYFVANKA